MKIRCDQETCSTNCRYYAPCNLHQSSHFNLLQVENELSWNINRLNELNKGINRYKQELNQYDDLPQLIKKYISKQDIQDSLRKAENEKLEVQKMIRELQVKELNMRKILERRS